VVSDAERRERFDALYDAQFARVWAYAVSRVGRQQAEDVVSQTFTVAWRKLDLVPREPLPWLIGVSRNVIRESRRDARRQEAIEAELRRWAAMVETTDEDVAEVVVSRATMLCALAELSESDREVFILVAWHGMSSRDAARALGCSRPAFFVRLHRARVRLERAIRRVGADPAWIRERTGLRVPTEEVCAP
jgi:RNA polymerase sigma-70 factor (ECF subfamily)